MTKHHPHNNIIERKLEQLPHANADHLWIDMHSILDKKMPQKKERRPFIVWWFLSHRGLLLMTFVFLLITGSSLFFLSTKEGSTITNKKLPGSQHPNKFIKDGLTKISQEPKENITTANGSNHKNGNNLFATTPSINSVDHVIANIANTRRTVIQSKKYTTTNQFNHSTEAIAKVNTDFDSAAVNLESIHHFLISSDHKEEKKSLSPQLQPVAEKVRTKTRTYDESGFYAGIISAVDLSSVHFQSAKPGATMGFLIGYSLNKKWSLESGLLWDTKRVYDNGSYFNPPGYTPTNGITIIAVNGKARLYELPVNIKYTIISGKHNLFATSGISSYLMRSENYDYEYTQNSQPGGHNYLNYTNETKDWFSVASFGIGYTHKIGGNGSIRIEPYLKLPIKNIGTGNMPIMSSGLNIGFTKPLKK